MPPSAATAESTQPQLWEQQTGISVAARLVCVPRPMAWVRAQKLSCPITPRACNHLWYRPSLIAYFCGSLYIWFVASHERTRLQLVMKVAEGRGIYVIIAQGTLSVEGEKVWGNSEGKSTAFIFRRAG